MIAIVIFVQLSIVKNDFAIVAFKFEVFFFIFVVIISTQFFKIGEQQFVISVVFAIKRVVFFFKGRGKLLKTLVAIESLFFLNFWSQARANFGFKHAFEYYKFSAIIFRKRSDNASVFFVIFQFKER